MTTWSYSPSLQTDKDRLRLTIGDTDSNAQQFQDTELTYILQTEGTVTAAAIKCCDLLVAKYARYVDQSVGRVKYSYQQLFDHYIKLKEQLEKASLKDGVAIYAGGISKTEKNTQRDDTDRVKSAFRRDIFEVPGAKEDTNTRYGDDEDA